MTTVCPLGHVSETTDFCDQCGMAIAGPPEPPEPAELVPDTDDDADTSPAARQEVCQVCTTPRSGDDRYCEACGFDFLGPPPAAVTWEAVVSADRERFERNDVDGLDFPFGYAERRFPLDRQELRIGRSRGRPAEEAPEIDLAGAPEDPGVSRRHAVLVRQQDGSYAVRDLGSTNGTTVNDDLQPIGSDDAVPLIDGDRIRLGAWTTITVHSR